MEAKRPKFDPCSYQNELSAAQRSNVAPMVKNFVKTCAFSLISKNTVLLNKNTMELLPIFPKKICLFNIPLYNFLADKPNCLPDSMKNNGSAYYETAKLFIKVFTKDSSVNDSFCYRSTCLKKRDVLLVVEGWMDCLYRVYHGGMIMCFEELMWLLKKTLDMVTKSGIYRYYVG